MSKYEKRPAQAPKPAPSAKIFIGRERQIADFRASVSYLLKKAEPPTGDFYPHLFIAYGEGGMGKTTLLDRWLEVARGEGLPPERIITVDLDYASYPAPHDLAEKIIAGLCRAFPDFDRGYRDVQARRQVLKGRHDELRDQWERWQAHLESGTTDELMRVWSTNLARTEVKKAKFGSAHAPLMLDNEGDDTRRELRALRGFLDASGRGPQTFGELLERELGADAALFEPATGAKALGNDIYELAEQRPLLLALDTYELADRHHDWLVELFFEAGDQVLLLIGGRNAVHKGDYHERRFTPELRPLVQAYDLGNETFSAEEIRQFVAQTLAAEPDDGDVARIEQISRGVPLAVEALAGALKESGDLRGFADVDTRSDQRNEIVRKVTNRFMRYAVEDGKRDSAEDKARKQADRAAIRGLALLLRPDPEQFCALWGCDDRAAETRISDLGGRHSFVFARAGSFELHDLVRQFIREDFWHAKSKQFEWPRLREGLRRVLALVEARLAGYIQLPREESYDTAEFREAVLDRLNLLLWLGELEEAKRWLLNRWLEARHYHRRLAIELEVLLHEITPRQIVWRKIGQVLNSKAGRRNFAALEPFTGLLESHAHMLYYYLWANQDIAFCAWDEDNLQTLTRNIDLLEQVRQLDPNFMPAMKTLAKALTRRGGYYASKSKEYMQALLDLNRSLEIDPANDAAYAYKAVVNMMVDNYEAAIIDIGRCIEINPHICAYWLLKARIESLRGNYISSINDYDHLIGTNFDDTDHLIGTNFDDADILRFRADIKFMIGRYHESILDYDLSIDIKLNGHTLIKRAIARRERTFGY